MVKKSPKDTRSRCWSVTIPAQPDDVDLDAVKEMGGELSGVAFTRDEVVSVVERYKGFRAQLEVSESGYVHWQGILYAKSSVRFSTLKRKFPDQWHMEAARAPEALRRYVEKSESRVRGIQPLVVGEVPEIRNSNRGKKIKEVIHDLVFEEGATFSQIVRDYPEAAHFLNAVREWVQIRDRKLGQGWREMTCTYIWGATGVGKTRWVYDQFGEDVYHVVDYSHPWDTYEGQSVIVLDEFYGDLKWGQFLAVLDGHPLLLPARYSDRPALHTRVVVISNKPLWEQYTKVPAHVWGAMTRRFHHVWKMTGEPSRPILEASRADIDSWAEHRPKTFTLPPDDELGSENLNGARVRGLDGEPM